MTSTAAATPSAGKSCGNRMSPTHPTPRYATAESQRGASIQTRFRKTPNAAPAQTVTRPTIRAVPVKATSANAVYVPAMKTKIIAWSSRRARSAGRRAAPREAMVERARSEHRSKSDGVHPHGKALQEAVRQGDQDRAGNDRGDERVQVEHATQPGNRDVHRRIVPIQPRRMRSQSTPTRSTRSATTSSRPEPQPTTSKLPSRARIASPPPPP